MDIYKQVHELIGLYYKRTDGGAEYLCLSPVEGTDVGAVGSAIIRVDGTEVFGDLFKILRGGFND